MSFFRRKKSNEQYAFKTEMCTAVDLQVNDIIRISANQWFRVDSLGLLSDEVNLLDATSEQVLINGTGCYGVFTTEATFACHVSRQIERAISVPKVEAAE